MKTCWVWHDRKAWLMLLMTAAVFWPIALPCVVSAQDVVAGTASDEDRYQANLRRWQNMTEEERQAIRDKAAAMSEADRAVLKEKFQEYRAMPAQDRERLRERFRKFRELPPDRRQALEKGSRGFRRLPPEKREEFRRRYREQRQTVDGERKEPAQHKNVTGFEVAPEKTLPDQRIREIPVEHNKDLKDRRPSPPYPRGGVQGHNGQMRRDNGEARGKSRFIKTPPEQPHHNGQMKADRPQTRRDPFSARGPQKHRK